MQDNLRLKFVTGILEWNDIYALKPYVPALSRLRQLDETDKAKQSTKWVYGFKKNMGNAQEAKVLVEALRHYLECDQILAVPPSDPDAQPNSLQSLFGQSLRRTRKVETRKYNHRKALPAGYDQSYEIPKLNAKRLLLIDDICTTGRTLGHFKEVLEKSGFDAVPAALGIHHRLDYKEKGVIVVCQEGEVEDEGAFENLLAVMKHLQAQGYKIKKSKLYSDRKKKLIRVQPDGSVFKKDADAYAKTLPMLGDPLVGLEAAQKEKLELETERLKVQTEAARLELDFKKGKLILKSDAELEISSHLTVIETSIRNMHSSEAGPIIELVGGDPKKIPLLAEFLGRKLDETFNRLAETDQFKVIFMEGADGAAG
jgi:hypothetical protein